METDVKVGDQLRILQRAHRMIVASVVVGTILICAGPLIIPPRYTAKSQILIEPQGLMAPQGSVIELPADEAVMLTQITALTSPDILTRTLDSLPSDPAFIAARSALAAKAESAEARLRARLTGWLPQAWFTATGEPGALSIRQLLEHLHVAQETSSHVVGVSITSINPEEAAAVANRLTRLYVEGEEQQKRASTDRTLSWLATRAPELRDEVKGLDAAVQAYRDANNIGGADPRAVSDKQIDDLNHQLGLAEIELTTVQARADGVRALVEQGADPFAVTNYVQSPTLSKLHERELSLRETIAAGDRSFVPGSAVMDKAKAELAEVRRQMTQEANRAISALTHQQELAAVVVQWIKQQLTVIRSASADVSLTEMERAASSTHHLYETILSRQEQLREQRESLSPGVRILSLAQPPIHPSSINPLLFIPPAAILSFILACFVAIARANVDRTLRSEREVSNLLGIPCVGLVPEVRRLGGAKPHQYLLNERFSPYTEAIRSVVAGLQMSQADQGSKVLLLSSSVPAEGKTTLAVSVAVYLAMLGRRVVLLDLDFRRPAIVRELGGEANGNLLELLSRHRPLHECIQRVPGVPLDFLVAPRRLSAEPLSLFASDDMFLLLQQLRNEYDHVVIDSAPLLATAEARLLAAMADKVLFVVKWGKTRPQVAINALGLLPANHLDSESSRNRVSAVVARVDLKRHARYGYGDSGECFMEYGNYFSGPKGLSS